MDISALKNEFYQCIKTAIEDFCKTENNRDVYVMALDCDSDVGMISLRYNNKARFEEKLPEYREYEEEYGWKVYGLHGSEYSAGEFDFIDYRKTELVKHFTDSYYYHSVGDYFGEGEPIEDIKDNCREIFWEMVTDTINRLKEEMDDIGVVTSDDFIFFYYDHDQSEEDRDCMISRTVDRELMKRLLVSAH